METCCPLSLSPVPPHPKSQAGCSWHPVLTLRGSRWMASHSQSMLLASTGKRTLMIGPQRPETRHRGTGKICTHPQKGATEAPPSPALDCTETAFSHSVETPFGRTARLLSSEAWVAPSSSTDPADLEASPTLSYCTGALTPYELCVGGGEGGAFCSFVLIYCSVC